MTGLSEIGVWEMLRDGKDIMQIVGEVPDEMHDWLNDVIKTLVSRYDNIIASASELYYNVRPLIDRKAQAMAVKDHPHAGIIFAMLDGKDYSPLVWKKLRPVGSRTYRIDIDK